MIKLKDGRAELYQWDTGRLLSVPNDCSHVHFSNKPFGRSVDVDVADGEAVIPDFLLQAAKPISVWCFVGTAENGFTKVSKQFEVVPRNKPADYVFTPTEQLTLRDLEQRIEQLEQTGGGGSVEPGGDWVTQAELSALETRMNEIHTDLSEATGRVEEQMSDVARDVSDLANDVGDLSNEVGNKYTKPDDGIPTSDLAEQTKADLVDAVLSALPLWEGGSY